MRTLSEPKDNVDIFPPSGNLHKSSYRRLGSEDEITGISETHAMLSQIKLKDEYKPVTYPRRSLLTMQSLALAEYVVFHAYIPKISETKCTYKKMYFVKVKPCTFKKSRKIYLKFPTVFFLLSFDNKRQILPLLLYNIIL